MLKWKQGSQKHWCSSAQCIIQIRIRANTANVQTNPRQKDLFPQQLLEYVMELLLSHSLVRLLICWSVGTDAVFLQTLQVLCALSRKDFIQLFCR